jgi:hypothetical protein
MQISIYVFLLSACGARVFEIDADVQARKALFDLMRVQEDFHRETGRYARNMLELEKYNLQYNMGVVYMEIESADKSKYRAVSLPSESTTARVFAYDTARGGFYEMDAEEVSSYVLGALNHIRKQQQEQKISDAMSALLVAILAGFGIRSWLRDGKKSLAGVYLGFLASLPPLGWSLAALNHMTAKTVFSPLVQGGLAISLLLALYSLAVCVRGFSAYARNSGPASLAGIFFSMAIANLLSIVVTIHAWVKYHA